MAGFLDLSPKSIWIHILWTFFVTPLIRRPQGPQGCQKMHKNILQMNMLSYGFTIQPKVTKNPKNLKDDQIMTVILVYTLIRAELFVDGVACSFYLLSNCY